MPVTDATAERNRVRAWLALVAPIAAALVIHARALAGGFVWDDKTFFIENDILPRLAPWDLGFILTEPVTRWGENRPLTEWLFVTQHWLFGQDVIGYHVVSLCLYALLGVVVALVVRDFLGLVGESRPWSTDAAAGLIVALFMLHPVHVECVAYVVGQEHLVASILGLTAVHLLLRAHRRGRFGSWRFWMPFLSVYYAAYLAKYQVVSIGLLVPCIWMIWMRLPLRRLLRAATVWAGVHVPIVVWILWSTRGYGHLQLVAGGPDEIVVRALRILGAHTQLALRPHPLNFGYPWIEQGNPVDGLFLLGLAVLVALLLALVRRRRSTVALGLIIFVVFLFPILQLVATVGNVGVFDRYLVLAILGPCLIMEWSLARLWETGRAGSLAARLVAGTLLVVLGALTWSYIPSTRSDLASARHAFGHFPEWQRVPFDLADSLIEAGELEEAERFVMDSPSLDQPPWVRSFFLGRIALARGRSQEAVQLLANAAVKTRLRGNFPFADTPLAEAWIALGRPGRARPLLEAVLTSRINHPVWKHRAGLRWRELFPDEPLPGVPRQQ